MYKILLLLLSFIFSQAQNIKIASYNVENLFDLTKQNSEYTEYIPNTKAKWNSKNFNIKLNNIIKVIKEIDADIIGLQEIENKTVLTQLFKRLPKYKYYSFEKYPRSAVGVGFLSKIKIINNKAINVKFKNKLFRPILESTFVTEDNIQFKIFNNHWPSKAVAESYRVKYAKKLYDRLKELPRDYDYILLGDFNSNYDEMNSFKGNKKLNNTSGITGINQILNTTIDQKFITFDDVLKSKKRVNFNLWLDLKNAQRFSNKYRKQNNTPDNIILSPALLDTKKLSYKIKSFKVFKPNYLYRNNTINRWQFSGSKYNKKHKGVGYSDHLPIYASFSTNKEDTNVVKKVKIYEKKYLNSIKDLYNKEKLIKPIILNDITVIYKNKDSAIIKKKNDKAIYIFKGAKNLKEGYLYDLQINQISTYNGLKEIVDFSVLLEKNKNNNYKRLYLEAKNIDILSHQFQNEIITNLKGKIKKKRLYFDKNKYIKIFAKDKKDLPINGKITFLKAHLGVYKGNIQILIHSKNDYKLGY